MIDNSYDDLKKATDDYRNCCEKLNKALREEETAFIEYKTKEKDIRVNEWGKLMSDEISKGKYDEVIKNGIFTEKLEYEKKRIARKILENQKDSIRERLYTIKKLHTDFI